MKRITLLLISILTVSVCFAQSDDDRWRKKYINLGFINTTMSLGFETRFGDCEYKEFGANSDKNASLPINKTNYNGWKAYLTFRF